jgi:glucosamine kinase
MAIIWKCNWTEAETFFKVPVNLSILTSKYAKVEMGLFIGIDGGGTKTKCVLVDDKLNVLCTSERGASNPLTIGIESSSEILFNLINEVLSKAKIFQIDSGAVGIAGGGRKSTANKIKYALLNLAAAKKLSLKKLEVVSDAEISVEGAFSGRPGVILIAGTGSIIFGKDEKGKLYRTGGYGRIIGDDGSGYSIGKKFLKAVAKDLDENIRNSLLLKFVMKKYSIGNRDDLITNIYSENFNVAELAEHVINEAEHGNRIMRKILDEEIDQLIENITSFEKIFPQKKIKMCFSGGLLSAENYYSKKLKREIKSSCKFIDVIEAVHPPEIGAAILAQKFTNHSQRSR